MLIPILKELFRRDLLRLQQEIENYRDEQKIWITGKHIRNSAGNLCLHLAGNLNTYIGRELGGTGYVRDRDLEFSRKDVPRSELIHMIGEVLSVVETTLDRVTEPQLAEEYPVLVFEQPMTTGHFLVHLLAHLNYHLGQINYHRRLLDA